jgi:hypothetical protein
VSDPSVTPFPVVVAPSRATPQLGLGRWERSVLGRRRPATKSRADFSRAARLATGHGAALATEIMRTRWRRSWRHAFTGQVVQPTGPCMSPLGYGEHLTLLDSGADHGCDAVPGVNADRDFAWAVVRRSDGITIGLISWHFPPGAYNAGTAIQRQQQHLSVAQWAAMETAVAERRAWLLTRCDVVVQGGDDNRPDHRHPGDRQTLRDGVVYLGIEPSPGVRAVIVRHRTVAQHADHPALVAHLHLTKVTAKVTATATTTTKKAS